MTAAENEQTPPQSPADTGSWPSTEWAASGHLPSSLAGDPEKLNALVLKYQAPLKAYLLAAFPGIGEAADVLLQDFAEDRILKEGWLQKPERNRGRFRDFLKASLKNFVRDRLRAKQAGVVLLTDPALLSCAEERGDEVFNLEWARAILAQVLERMEAECRKPRGKNSLRTRTWEVFRLRLLQPILEGAEPTDYQDLVSQLGISSPTVAQDMLITAKRMFRRHLTAVIAEYERRGPAARAELGDLRQFLDFLSRKKASPSTKSAGTTLSASY